MGGGSPKMFITTQWNDNLSYQAHHIPTWNDPYRSTWVLLCVWIMAISYIQLCHVGAIHIGAL